MAKGNRANFGRCNSGETPSHPVASRGPKPMIGGPGRQAMTGSSEQKKVFGGKKSK